MTLTGDLRQRNCTTLFTEIHTSHSDKYYLRIENQGFKSTATCDPLQIHVRDSAWRPSVQISGSLREQQTVVISCSALTPCPDAPPVLSWSLQQTPAHSLLPNPDGTVNSIIQQSLLLSEEHHGLELLCSALYPVRGGYKEAKTTMTLTVDHSTHLQARRRTTGQTARGPPGTSPSMRDNPRPDPLQRIGT
uniref:Ig-like domain-containing protein n=1 Tax=Knipowitschia caucasica TaxID=637954 RepID=A0AAV2MGU8_KNICA